MIVVLPAPLGPISPTICPSATSRSTPATARSPPNVTVNAWVSSSVVTLTTPRQLSGRAASGAKMAAAISPMPPSRNVKSLEIPTTSRRNVHSRPPETMTPPMIAPATLEMPPR